ncbi:MAG TPA: hypothetical protein VFH17_01590 [Coriobacteriia bacterium]|nr:hypothetical protein [Coriobacteriia bacterium]
MSGEPDQLYVEARRALLDALDALGPQAAAIVLVGAQAIYLHAGDAQLAVAVQTRDGDLAVDPRGLRDQPSLESAMEPGDRRSVDVRVAGPAALLVAKLHKVAERRGTPDRLVDKDALDIYRLLVAVRTPTLARAMRGLLADRISAQVTRDGVTYLREC